MRMPSSASESRMAWMDADEAGSRDQSWSAAPRQLTTTRPAGAVKERVAGDAVGVGDVVTAGDTTEGGGAGDGDAGAGGGGDGDVVDGAEEGRAEADGAGGRAEEEGAEGSGCAAGASDRVADRLPGRDRLGAVAGDGALSAGLALPARAMSTAASGAARCPVLSTARQPTPATPATPSSQAAPPASSRTTSTRTTSDRPDAAAL
jgi:hypothetical protein